MIMYFTFKTYPGGGAFALFFHPHPREFATQNKKSANARGLARGGGWAQLELTGALVLSIFPVQNLVPSRGHGRQKTQEAYENVQTSSWFFCSCSPKWNAGKSQGLVNHLPLISRPSPNIPLFHEKQRRSYQNQTGSVLHVCPMKRPE